MIKSSSSRKREITQDLKRKSHPFMVMFSLNICSKEPHRNLEKTLSFSFLPRRIFPHLFLQALLKIRRKGEKLCPFRKSLPFRRTKWSRYQNSTSTRIIRLRELSIFRALLLISSLCMKGLTPRLSTSNLSKLCSTLDLNLETTLTRQR